MPKSLSLSRILTNRKFLFFVGSVLVFFLLLNYVVMPFYVYHGGTLRVPNLVGLHLERAQEILDSLGLDAVQADSKPDPKKPIGTVVGQNPEADAVVKYGRRVYLTISGGEVMVSVPSLRGRSSRDARFALERNGLNLGTIEYATSDMYPENTIIEQTIPANTQVPKGTLVGIIISQGRMIEESVVPELVGKTVAEAERLLRKHGLKVGNITYQTSSNLLPNTVVDQFPRSGDAVKNGQAVDLFVIKVGKAPDEIPEPER